MRWLLCALAVLSGCESLQGRPTGRTETTSVTSPTLDCEWEGWETAANASVTTESMIINGASYSPGFVLGKSYPDMGASACYDPETWEFEWLLEVDDVPWARVTVQTDGTVGLQDLADYYGNAFEIDVLDPDQLVYFENSDFYLGTWQVLSFEPFSFSMNGSAESYGDTATMSIYASMDWSR